MRQSAAGLRRGVRPDHRHLHAVTQRGQNANQEVTRDVFEIIVQNGCYSGSRCAGSSRDLRVRDLFSLCDLLQPLQENTLDLPFLRRCRGQPQVGGKFVWRFRDDRFNLGHRESP